ncbi:AB hydrolase superfamily protein C4A8.06c [Exophiala dermatitidis]
MTISTIGVGAAVTPTVLKTYISHYANRRPRRHKPTAHISYDEGLHLIRAFLEYASHHTVEDLQSFTAQKVPTPSWVRTENVNIPNEHISKAAHAIISQLGEAGVQNVGGTQWWQWRGPKEMELKAEWIEMRAHYNEQQKKGGRSRRIMLYIHGGAYFFGSVDEHRYQMQRHARKLEARVFAPRYRLAPQFPFPCGLQDCLAAYLYLLSLHEPAEIILAGDSAGGGMVVSILCLLRDQGIPLPAGAILISPWVDLTHSFPSLVGSDELDYIPPRGFMHKPSMAWPPPNDEELKVISALSQGKGGHIDINEAATAAELQSGFSEHKLEDLAPPRHNNAQEHPADVSTSVPIKHDGAVQPASQHYLSVELVGKLVLLKDQIQMYTTNQLLAHPLVSPVLQPSLGGLPPVMILTGGGELLRDEQIYLAHKMANPSGYPLGSAYRSNYDPDDILLKRYRPTPVQLQVWDDLCHVATTLSFTRPAKLMYRSIAQFGAWALARAQRRAIEIMEDDNISIISSDSEGDGDETEEGASTDHLSKPKLDPTKVNGSVGRAGDPLPPFEGNMVRQRVDRHGMTYPLAHVQDLPALQLRPDEVGVVKPGPVRKWLEARKRWDAKYASVSIRVRKERIKALASGSIKGFEEGEKPPPSALAARRTDKDLLRRKQKGKSFGLAMWSGWGSKHDESTLKREEEAVRVEKSEEKATGPEVVDESSEPQSQAYDGMDAQITTSHDSDHLGALQRHDTMTRLSSRTRSQSRKRRGSSGPHHAAGRRRTVSVTDTGQTEGRDDGGAATTSSTLSTTNKVMNMTAPGTISAKPPIISSSVAAVQDQHQQPSTTTASDDPALLSAGFLPRFKAAAHLRDDSAGTGSGTFSDTASNMTSRSGRSGLGAAADDASTRAVFAAHGVSKDVENVARDDGEDEGSDGEKETSLPHAAASLEDNLKLEIEKEKPKSSPSPYANNTNIDHVDGVDSEHIMGSDTPRSQRSLARLYSHQQDEGMMGHMEALRSPSSIAVVRAEGVVGVVDGGHSPNGDDGGNDHDHNIHPDSPVVVDDEKSGHEERKGPTSTSRPKLYDRAETTFQTAVERLDTT